VIVKRDNGRMRVATRPVEQMPAELAQILEAEA
jgi:hypothetical protein